VLEQSETVPDLRGAQRHERSNSNLQSVKYNKIRKISIEPDIIDKLKYAVVEIEQIKKCTSIIDEVSSENLGHL
jgi:hypothetical protein